MIKQSKEILVVQIKSLVVYQFLNLFNKLEKKIKEDFKNSLKNIDCENLNRLYFYYGGMIGTYIDHEMETVKLTENKYQRNEEFGLLKINQILKMNKTAKIIKKYDHNLKSLQREATVFDLQSSIVKLINMRNILAHEIYECSFKDKDIIEVLSNEKIRELQFDFLTDYDTDLMDDMTKAIISNYYYMLQIVSMIGNKEEVNSENV